MAANVVQVARRAVTRLRTGTAMRISVRGELDPEPLRDRVPARARALNVTGWLRVGEPSHLKASGEPAAVRVHAEGEPEAVGALVAFVRDLTGALGGAGPAAGAEPGAIVDVEPVAVEGHEQFAVRGVSAGVFVVQEHQATAHHFDLRLQVGDAMRSWAVPKGPSLDPGVKRFAVQVADHSLKRNRFEGRSSGGGVIIWDHGSYEQGGRVAWPQALERGHAVFVLHGEKLRGGFALQRTRTAEPAQWLLIKRRDLEARPGSEIVAELPHSVLSGRSLEEILAGGH